MTTRAIGGLNSSEEREGQQMVPAHGRNDLQKFRKQMHGPDRRNLQLHFQSMLPDSFFTKRNVEGQRGASIHVKLIDTSTGDVVRSGPESCVKLKVVVVEGDFNNEDDDDWVQEDFESRIVKEREGKSPLLIGKLHVHLKEGVGALGNLSFTDNSSWTRSKKFRLGVEVASGLREGIRVREAITNPFVVKDCRGEVYEKRELPALDDEVWRLKQIRQNGAFHKRLNDKGIFVVKDFLGLLGTDPKGLRKILGSGMREKMWDALVQHAKTCDPRGTETLSDSQEVFTKTLKKEASAKRKDIVECDALLPLEMNPSKKARSSQTDLVAPESCPSDTDQRVSPAFLTNVAPQPGLANLGPTIGDDFCNHTVAGSLHGFFNNTVERGSSSSVLSENYEYGSRTSFSSIGDMVSVLNGKYHVYYADNVKKSGVVFKIMSELCGLIEGGEYNSAETLSDSQKVLVDTLEKKAYENWMHVVECDDQMLLNMKQSKRASSSRTEVVIEAPADYHVSLDQQVSLPPLPSSVPPEQTFMNSMVAVGGGVGYDENFGNRYQVHSHRSNAQIQMESNAVERQLQVMSSSHQSQTTRNDHMIESASCFGFQSTGSSGLPSNLIFYDDQSPGYNNNRGADEFFSAQMQMESNAVERLMQLMSSSHQSQITRNDHMIESASCFGFQSIGSSGLPSNLIFYDDQSAGYNNNRGADEFFSAEEEIRMRSHEMLGNDDDMLQPLCLLSTGAAPTNASNDGYPYSSYIQPPATNFNFEEDLRSLHKAVVGWLRLKAAMRWDIFIRKKAAERRAQLVELED